MDFLRWLFGNTGTKLPDTELTINARWQGAINAPGFFFANCSDGNVYKSCSTEEKFNSIYEKLADLTKTSPKLSFTIQVTGTMRGVTVNETVKSVASFKDFLITNKLADFEGYLFNINRE